MAILVTGGAGYIGSTTVELLQQQGEEVVVLDNLSRGHRQAVADDITFYQGDVGDRALVEQIAQRHEVEACVHFAAFAYVGESVLDPAMYFTNNVEQGLALLDVLRQNGLKHFVFSSTCATYGEPQVVPIGEDHPQSPANPYGWTKFIMERALESYDDAYGVRFVALRYFNAAGATATRGEDHEHEPHLLPIVLGVAQGKRPKLSVFGTDYPTPDGTAIRDYIHVSDLGSAHILALKHLRAGGQSERINLGNGEGYSVLEVIEAARKITGCPIAAEMAPRRAGDPSRLIANAAKAREVLGWEPGIPTLEGILESAWNWHRAHPNGYE